MKYYIYITLVLLCLFSVVSFYPLRAQQITSKSAPDTNVVAGGFTVGGFGKDYGGGVLFGGMVRFLPLNDWFTMDLSADLGVGIPDEGRDRPKSFHVMFGMNAYLPLKLRWTTFHKDMIPRPNELKPYVSLGIGGARFGGFDSGANIRRSSDGGGEINAGFGLEFRFNRKFIFYIEPRGHALASRMKNPGSDGYVTLKFGFLWVGHHVQSNTHRQLRTNR